MSFTITIIGIFALVIIILLGIVGILTISRKPADKGLVSHISSTIQESDNSVTTLIPMTTGIQVSNTQPILDDVNAQLTDLTSKIDEINSKVDTVSTKVDDSVAEVNTRIDNEVVKV